MLNRIRKIMMTMAALTVVVTAAHYVAVDSASALYCRVTAFPVGNWVPDGPCARSCNGQLFRNLQTNATYCYVPPFEP